jgi:glyoxylase-like metal-dependent hydrolase (beta-lactamase superfamily II)
MAYERQLEDIRMSLNFRVGDLTIHRIVELEGRLDPASSALPALTPEILAENRHWLQPDSLNADDLINLCYQSYVVRTPHHVILVDSCLGNHKRRQRPEWNMKSDDTWMRALGAAGLSVEDIDFVMCTHLHLDHVGWNTRLVNGEWVPTFPNARYLFNQTELADIEARNERTGYPAYVDSVVPILRAGRADLVGDHHEIGDHVRFLPTPGHTEGHMAFCFGKKKDDAVFTGDLLHVPLQARYPELSWRGDKDPVKAAATRRGFLERFCDTPTLCCTAHFPSPSVGHVKRWGSGYRLHYAR